MSGTARKVTAGAVGLVAVALGLVAAPGTAWAKAPALAISNNAAPGQPVGSSIYDTATIGGGIDPTGTVTFRLFRPSDPSCGGTPVFTWVTKVTRAGYYQSGTYVPTVAGTFRWTASYSGDGNDPAAASACAAPGATVDVAKLRPALAVSANVSGTGSTTTASGALRGASPTGTVAFKLYGPGNATCAGTPAFSSSRTVTRNDSYTSAAFTAIAGGPYRWVVSYSGDANNEPSSTGCADSAGAVNLIGGVTFGAGPAIVLANGTLTVTWNGIANPSTSDWIGLYFVGAPDSAVRAWRYTTGTAGGSVTLKVPWTTLPGAYEVRLFSRNSYARLATPAVVTVI